MNRKPLQKPAAPELRRPTPISAEIVSNVPAGDIAATNVQDAINELDTEKVAKAGDTMTGKLTILSDSVGITLGGGSDMEAKYNGTKGIINTSLIAPSDLEVSCGTDKTIILAETVWDELPPTPIISAKLGLTAPTLATFVGNVEQYTFDATNDYIIGATELTHTWKEGTNIYPHIHWATNGVDAGETGVKWSLEYTIGDTSEVFAGAATTVVDATIPASTTDRTHYLSTFDTVITGTNYRIGAYICWQLRRVASAKSAPAADPFAIAIGFHVEVDTMGSRTISAK